MLLVVTYDLLRDADPDAFARWSYDLDRPACLALSSCSRFDVYLDIGDRVQRPASVVELIEVTSWEAWQREISTATHAPFMVRWREFADEPTLVIRVAEPHVIAPQV